MTHKNNRWMLYKIDFTFFYYYPFRNLSLSLKSVSLKTLMSIYSFSFYCVCINMKSTKHKTSKLSIFLAMIWENS